MTWLEGQARSWKRLEEAPPLEERNAYARALFHAWYVPFYRYGVIHGDPHLGNYQVREPVGDDASRHQPAGLTAPSASSRRNSCAA
jgi:predicted unusual protein kinase regulating ubiquinone biosynthesis (AarF/ABC1/UbiB family)